MLASNMAKSLVWKLQCWWATPERCCSRALSKPLAPSLTTKAVVASVRPLQRELRQRTLARCRARFARRDLPVHDFPMPIGPHAQRAQDHPLLLTLDRAATGPGHLSVVLARGIGDLDPHTIDEDESAGGASQGRAS